jgi:hypothetical protein
MENQQAKYRCSSSGEMPKLSHIGQTKEGAADWNGNGMERVADLGFTRKAQYIYGPRYGPSLGLGLGTHIFL